MARSDWRLSFWLLMVLGIFLLALGGYVLLSTTAPLSMAVTSLVSGGLLLALGLLLRARLRQNTPQEDSLASALRNLPEDAVVRSVAHAPLEALVSLLLEGDALTLPEPVAARVFAEADDETLRRIMREAARPEIAAEAAAMLVPPAEDAKVE